MVRNENHDTIFSPMVKPLAPIGENISPKLLTSKIMLRFDWNLFHMEGNETWKPWYNFGQPSCLHGGKRFSQRVNFHNNAPIWVKLVSYERLFFIIFAHLIFFFCAHLFSSFCPFVTKNTNQTKSLRDLAGECRSLVCNYNLNKLNSILSVSSPIWSFPSTSTEEQMSRWKKPHL